MVRAAGLQSVEHWRFGFTLPVKEKVKRKRKYSTRMRIIDFKRGRAHCVRCDAIKVIGNFGAEEKSKRGRGMVCRVCASGGAGSRLESKTVKELKATLKGLGLSTPGLKQVLVQRLFTAKNQKKKKNKEKKTSAGKR